MIPGGVRLTSSTWAHYTGLPVIFIPDKFSLKWETESLKTGSKEVSGNQPPTNAPAGFMHSKYGTHTYKYLVNWRNYTNRDPNLKWPKCGSFDIPKLIFLHAKLEKAGHAYFDWYLEAFKQEMIE